ncbi:MAG TPA: DUF3034 family protein [Woeseiaceae bacterium]
MSFRSQLLKGVVAFVASLGTMLPAEASNGGRLLATGGAVSIEATAGGGITPWAVLAGYGTSEQFGCAAAGTIVSTDDYGLETLGIACTWNNRVELSIGRQSLDLDGLRPLLGLPPEQKLRQRHAGIKVRLGGDIVYNPYGQLSLGLLHKSNEDKALVRAAGAARTSDAEIYLSAGKLILDGPFGLITYLNGSLRWSRANQTGLLGFGGDRRDSRRINTELAAAIFPSRQFAVGFEYRDKPDNLSFAAEDDWRDLFVAWFPSKHFSIVAAWADLGSIGTLSDQSGPYLSIAGSF